jgi:cytochrome d ubiquinol oxidase subunit II
MTTLQLVWFLLIGVLLVGYAVLDGFDLGVGFWSLFTREDRDRRRLLQSIGPLWDGNEVWLLTAGGALFAAFPPVYATVFSGFYLAMMLVLLGLILRATAIEFRSQVESPAWRGAWDKAFAVGSILPALLFGVAIGNLVRGLPLNEAGNYTGGFFALLNPYALLVGLTGLAMFVSHGALWIALRTRGEQAARARLWAAKASLVYLALFLATSAWSLAAMQRGSAIVPIVASLIALAAIVGARILSRAGADGKAFVASSVSIAALFGAIGGTLYPNLVPATNDPTLSLTLVNASSSENTLGAMLIVALIGMPLVLVYTVWIYRTFAGRIE